jgi:hypothetical protein
MAGVEEEEEEEVVVVVILRGGLVPACLGTLGRCSMMLR